jgi:hypothetical protein
MHIVTTAEQMGWAKLSNGLLIESAERVGFDVFLTGDQGILYQQNHSRRLIPIVLLSKTYWPDVDASSARIREAIEKAGPGSFTIVEIKTNALDRKLP